MGIFDTVRIVCPHCGGTHEEQTKSGPCRLEHVRLADASPDMISGLHDRDGFVWCSHCNKPMQINLVNKPTYEAVPITLEDDE